MEPRDVVNALMKGRYDEIHDAGDEGFRRAIPAKEIQRVWLSLTDKLGQPTSVGDGVVLHDLALHFADGQAHLQVAYRDGQIAGLVLRHGPPTGRFGE